MKKTQEDLDDISSRAYVSRLERGGATPTITTVHDLTLAIGLHPLTVFALSYAKAPNRKAVEELFVLVAAEVEALGAERLVDAPLRARKPDARRGAKKVPGLPA